MLDWANKADLQYTITEYTPTKNGILYVRCSGDAGKYIGIKDVTASLYISTEFFPCTALIVASAILAKNRKVTIETLATKTQIWFYPFK